MRRDLIPLREIPANEAFDNQYVDMALIMTILMRDAIHGKPVEGNCHSIARAVAKSFPDFVVVDGFLPRLVGNSYGESFGREIHFFVPPAHTLYHGREEHLYHSWLAWKQDERFVVDLCPLGGVPGCAPPVAYYQDEYSAMLFQKGSLPKGITEEFLAPLVEAFDKRFRSVVI
ncbi:MAG: hypothetical protein KBC50_01495 [Candidatus Pacebacteria bacterium]|jgi:hypothetical protein|nr:hypothetical protein [Candidatus Paceibacterota bacterium]